MKVYVVGNPLIPEDSVPIKLLPKLKSALPHVTFEEADPNENFIPEDGSIIIDTVQGIGRVTWFDSLDDFVQTKSVSPHDYDLGLHLKLLIKIQKIQTVRIIGIPYGMKDTVLEQIVSRLKDEKKP